MAKPSTPETIAATLTSRERLALLEIRDGNPLNWEGGGDDAEKLIKKRLMRRGNDGSFSLTTRGRDVLLALFSAEARERDQPPPFAIGADGQTERPIPDVKGPASNPSDMGHENSAPNLPRAISSHSPPLWMVSHSAAGGVFGFAESVPASPPHVPPSSDSFERLAAEALLNPDPAVEREICRECL